MIKIINFEYSNDFKNWIDGLEISIRTKNILKKEIRNTKDKKERAVLKRRLSNCKHTIKYYMKFIVPYLKRVSA